jgi:hypothetical protein
MLSKQTLSQSDCIFIPAFTYVQMNGKSLKNPKLPSNLLTLVTIKYVDNSEVLSAFMDAIENGLIDY